MKTGLKVVLGIILFVWLIGIIGSIFSTKSIAKKIEKDPDFEYTTSLTSNYDRSDKANVYTTKMSVKEAARHLINEDRPLDYTDLDNDEAIQLMYDDYYVLIYESEAGETYIQISSRKYIHNNGYYGLYRPYRNNIIVFYDRAYTSSRYYGKDTSRYGSGYAKSTKTVKTSTNSSSTTDTKTDNSNSTKIKTDKNASSKIKTQNSKTNSTSSGNSTSSKTSTSKTSSSSSSKSSTSSSSSSSNSVRSGSVGTKSRVGGGTSFGK